LSGLPHLIVTRFTTYFIQYVKELKATKALADVCGVEPTLPPETVTPKDLIINPEKN
jgi:hypothetical protein